MAWRELVPGCFGSVDVYFAIHSSDLSQAKRAVKEAMAVGTSREEFMDELVRHVDTLVKNPSYRTDCIKYIVKGLTRLWPPLRRR
jgi:hypothetical protein